MRKNEYGRHYQPKPATPISTANTRTNLFSGVTTYTTWLIACVVSLFLSV